MFNDVCVVESTLVSSSKCSAGATVIAPEVSALLSSQPLRRVLPETTLQMPAATSTNLWQQILHIASTCSDRDRSDRNQVLTEIAAAVGEAFKADGCIIVLPDIAQATAQAAVWLAEMPSQSLQQLKVAPDFTNLLSQSEPIGLDNIELVRSPEAQTLNICKLVTLWQSVEGSWASLQQVRAVLGTTTRFQGLSNGVISLMRSRPYRWTESDIAGLQTVAHQVASVIDQLQQQQLIKQIQYQQVVNQLTLAIHNASDLNTVLKLATDGTANALQVRRSKLLRLKYWDSFARERSHQIPKIRVHTACEWQNATADSTLAQADSASLPSDAHQSFWMSECTLCQQAFLNPDSPIIIADGQQPQSDAGISVAATFNLENLPALLLSPLESQGTVLGFLVFQHDQAHVWQPEELELVQLVSAQVSTAIIQTETLRQVQALVEKRTAELRASLSLQAKLYDRTRQQLDQLRRLNQMKDEFLSTVSHELRTPLTSMTMAIRMLRQTGLSGDRSSRYLDILEQQCAQETNLINDLLGLQELESNQVTMYLQDIDLKALVQDLTRLFQQKWSSKGLTLETKLPRKLKLLSDRESLHRVLLELLTNAGKYAEPNSCVQLHITQTVGPSGNQVVMTIRNTGSGIAPEELPLIFDKFKRCQGATQNAIQGTGLGLALVQSLVQLLNGTITASSCSTDDIHACETCFTLTLPQHLDNAKVL